MKVFIVLLACFVAAEGAGDLICLIGGNIACKINCIASGQLHGGSCHPEKNECNCITQETDVPKTPKQRSELLCLLGGNLACEINCLTSVGHFLGHCDENNDCKCIAKPQPEARTDLACQLGGDPVCESFCHLTTNKKVGHCTAEQKCVCTARP